VNTLKTANSQYANRPADERFPSVDALVSHSLEQKNHSAERTFNIKDLSAEPSADAGLMLKGPNGSARFTHWSFGQFARSLGAPASYLRDGLPAELAADCLNYGISQTAPGTDLNLLLKQPNGSPDPIVRAATSDKYGRVWDADLYGAVAQNIAGRDGWDLPPTWSGETAGAYAGDRDSFLILCNGGSIVTDPTLSSTGNDQMFRGILIKNSEVGASSIVIDTILYRYVCGNHMLWGAVIDKSFRRRHIGSNVTREAIREISRIAYAWTNQSTARDQQIIAGLISHQIAATKDAVIDELRSFGATREQATAAYESCERNEPSASPRSYWGAAQGLTRVSQDTVYQNERYELDRLASAVLARGAKLVRAS
jgi:hypothetical protein